MGREGRRCSISAGSGGWVTAGVTPSACAARRWPIDRGFRHWGLSCEICCLPPQRGAGTGILNLCSRADRCLGVMGLASSRHGPRSRVSNCPSCPFDARRQFRFPRRARACAHCSTREVVGEFPRSSACRLLRPRHPGQNDRERRAGRGVWQPTQSISRTSTCRQILGCCGCCCTGIG
jgi:hypothetical protein